ncbi:disintegrin and metalloproteinase domain-containing protein 9 isoform X2 [Denticeps clupeoides]|uniref:disintegrin and metalloproteinase domain-containing protein 9 isoform X2 n=1 Tax=Denticeps clupeoides TaxID=299321 RepID=UPI0010A42749|nr:disintegrin and metalloproteinase domain-containing protein 9-like isoform X2 [Denticeps clupeoides]
MVDTASTIGWRPGPGGTMWVWKIMAWQCQNGLVAWIPNKKIGNRDIWEIRNWKQELHLESGSWGIILVGNASYGLEPVPQSSANEHLLFALKDSPSQPFVCGLTDGMDEVLVPYSPDLSKLLRQKRTLPQTRYVEAVFVVDSLRFNLTKRNSTAVRMQMVELANLLDGYYKPLNVRIVLVGLVTFDTGNPFSVQGSAGDVLGRFASWRSKVLLAQKKNDLSQLTVGLPGPYPGGVLGMAFVGSVCSASTAAGISVFSDNTVSYYSTIIAHEIGHNLGMIHDSAACKCQEKQCIMEAMSTGATQFSDCSSNGFENFILGGGGVCLRNQPTASDVVTVAQCGNGLLEMGEECDCGTPQECKNRCCDAATCRLTPGSACAQGSCCSNCQLQVSGTVCRQSVNQCDLAEYCNGTSSFCPSDFYLMDGLPCAGNTAYCYEGRCQTYDYQCSNLFGSGAMKADDMCFKYVNTIGDRFGNCGYSNSNPLPCSVANVMCGKIQCTNFDSNNPPNGVSISVVTIGNGTVCKNADYNLGSDVLDPAYVKTGSMCAVGKVCINFQCVNSSALHGNATCDAKINCSSNGVCNNMGHCHCNDGWAPLNCDRAGRGGSIDSGPAQIDYSLRNGLLIFFLLVVPILVLIVLVLLYFFKRDALKPCLKSRRSKGSGNTQSRVYDNFQRAASPQPPIQQLPTNPQPLHLYPPVRSGLSVSSENLDNSEMKDLHQQGPGVPRPIPPRQVQV